MNSRYQKLRLFAPTIIVLLVALVLVIILLKLIPATTSTIPIDDVGGYTIDGTRLLFNPSTGDLTGIDFPAKGLLQKTANMRFDGAYIDFCFDGGDGGYESWGCYNRNTLFYQNMDWLNTYQLPETLQYNDQSEYPRRTPASVTISQSDNSVKVQYEMKPYDETEVTFGVETTYRVDPGGFVAMDAVLTNLSNQTIVINGAATVISGLDLAEDALVELPGNLPADVFSCSGIPELYTILGQYASPLIHFVNGEADLSLIFANPYEKWMPSITKALDGKLEVINLSCTIDQLQAGETLTFGTQFFQMSSSGSAYDAARQLYSTNGWEAPTDGVKGSPVYSGHPAGVSDNDFQGAAGTLDGYQAELARIKGLGFDSLWMLPVFEHPESGGSIYLPYNMEYVDFRYSKRVTDSMSLAQKRETAYAEMKDFGKAAQEVGLEFMIDYVPHGPYLYNPDQNTDPDNLYSNPWMTPDRLSWATVDRWWQDPDPAYTHWREEWNCYAFDMANPDYINYMYQLAKKQAADFNMSGTRIDAVMGSLPNWNPSGNNRISQTGLGGGAAVSAAIRQGIKDAGYTPYVLPENNNPTPYYAAYTDLFYDMPFYLVTKNARDAGLSEIDFAAVIAHWLSTEKLSGPKGMQYGRFLQNHDTVSPWYPNFDGMRAVDVYGAEKARALWVLLSTIDGAPIIYQNDELGNEDFFTRLLAMRKAQFGSDNSMDIEYYNDIASGIVAFRRFSEKQQKLVLVNLTNKENKRDFSKLDIGGVRLSTSSPTIVYGDAALEGDTVKLPAYGAVVLSLSGGEAFTGTNTATQYLVRDIIAELGEQNERYLQMADNYRSFEIAVPAYTSGQVENSKVLFDPVEEFSDITADGSIWKYMYYNGSDQSLNLCTTIEVNAGGVWRAYRTGTGDYDFEWTGAGRSTSYYPANRYFELDTNTDGGNYGILTFVAPKTGSYTIPAFKLIGVGEGYSSILVVLKNGVQVAKSDMLQDEWGQVQMAPQSYDLNAGETLMFYSVRMDGKYCYFQMDNMQLQYASD